MLTNILPSCLSSSICLVLLMLVDTYEDIFCDGTIITPALKGDEHMIDQCSCVLC